MASPSSCCPPTAWGASLQLEGYTAKGIGETIGASLTPIYYTSPETASQKAIVVFTDVWGITDRMKAMCDVFASHDFHVIMMDCFRGTTMDSNPYGSDFVSWLKQYPYDDVVKNDTHACLEYLKSKNIPASNIASIGFCWGGWAIAKSASEGVSWKCAISPHPSTKIENFIFGLDESSMFEKGDFPFLILPAGDDMENIKPGSDIVKNLESKGGKSVPFEKMNHGWVSRGDLSQEDVKKDV